VDMLWWGGANVYTATAGKSLAASGSLFHIEIDRRPPRRYFAKIVKVRACCLTQYARSPAAGEGMWGMFAVGPPLEGISSH